MAILVLAPPCALEGALATCRLCVMWGRAVVAGGGVRFQDAPFSHGCPLQMSPVSTGKPSPALALFSGKMLQGYQNAPRCMLLGFHSMPPPGASGDIGEPCLEVVWKRLEVIGNALEVIGSDWKWSGSGWK